MAQNWEETLELDYNELPESVEDIVEESEDEAEDKVVVCVNSSPRDKEQAVPQENLDAENDPDSRSIYVGNVDYSVKSYDLLEHFTECGNILRVTIPKHFTGAPKGFAYLEFAEAEAVEKAKELEGSLLRGRAIQIAPKRKNCPGKHTADSTQPMN